MANKIELNIHSVVDVITNSSTELFVCNTDKTPKMIDEMLAELIKMHNNLIGDDLEFKNAFLPTRVYSQGDATGNYGCGRGFEGGAVGKIVIEGVDDNSIPYELFDLIERAFRAERHHLG